MSIYDKHDINIHMPYAGVLKTCKTLRLSLFYYVNVFYWIIVSNDYFNLWFIQDNVFVLEELIFFIMKFKFYGCM